jgi:hypothetical protein
MSDFRMMLHTMTDRSRATAALLRLAHLNQRDREMSERLHSLRHHGMDTDLEEDELARLRAEAVSLKALARC